MTIDGNNIKTLYGLIISNLEDFYNLPERKKILTNPGFDEKDIRYEPQIATIKLIGSYPDKSELFAKISAFKTLIQSSLIHQFSITEHSLTFNGVVTEGIKIEPVRNVVRVNFKVTIT